jgi:hypothetical protein
MVVFSDCHWEELGDGVTKLVGGGCGRMDIPREQQREGERKRERDKERESEEDGGVTWLAQDLSSRSPHQ